jgi:hypothetical protein
MAECTIVTEYNPITEEHDGGESVSSNSSERILDAGTLGKLIISHSQDDEDRRDTLRRNQLKLNTPPSKDPGVDLEFLKKDLCWSITSNIFFLFGSIVYIISVSWDCISSLHAHSTLAYHFFEWAGPAIYLMNSVIDVGWANFLQARNRNLRKNRDQRQSGSKSSTSTPIRSLMLMNWNRIRKHAAHRRGLFAALSFGFAALFGLVDLILYYYYGDYERTMIAGLDRGIMDALSIHMYLVSALFAVTGRRSRPRSWTFTLTHPDNLEDLGDLFFLIGGLVDVVLCDSSFHNNAAFWQIFATSLWFIDACFYLRSDMLTRSVYDEVTLLYTNGQISASSSSSCVSGSTKVLLLNRLAKISGDKDADRRLASNICKINKSLV